MEVIKSKTCSVDGCDRKFYGRGYCVAHWARWRKRGTTELLTPQAKLEGDVARFWRRVAITANPDRCWLWQGLTAAQQGYGTFCHSRNKSSLAHRYSWELANGRPPKLFILHSCDNRACVNPKHLREGTSADNRRDAVERKRLWWLRTNSCKRGHPATPENSTYRMVYDPRMKKEYRYRICKACKREWDRAKRKAVKDGQGGV